jgi:hypothetical protein
MKRIKRVKLTRLDRYGDNMGILSTVGYYDYPLDGKVCFGLCDTQLEEYFSVTKECKEIDLVLSAEDHIDAYAVRKESFDYIEVKEPNDTVHVDDELATLIGNYARKVHGDRSVYVYLSLEFPKGV